MILSIPFQTTDWNALPAVEQGGESGTAYRRTLTFGDLRIRCVEYSAGYKADHWCERGHILYCVEGEIMTELSDGTTFTLKKGMSYQVSDYISSHRSYTISGAKLFIIDGGFLNPVKTVHKKGIWM
jgi:hypothetical protein